MDMRVSNQCIQASRHIPGIFFLCVGGRLPARPGHGGRSSQDSELHSITVNKETEAVSSAASGYEAVFRDSHAVST